MSISAFMDARISSVHFRKAIWDEIYFDGILDVVVSNNDTLVYDGIWIWWYMKVGTIDVHELLERERAKIS